MSPTRSDAAATPSTPAPGWLRTSLSVLLVVALAIGVVGCGKRGGTSGGDSGGNSGGDGGGKGPSVGLVTDLGGLNDRSFNALANKGLEKAENDLGTQGVVIESKSASDYEKNLGQFAQQKKDLTIGVGFLMADSINNVATKATDTKFAIIDYSVKDAPFKSPANVRGLIFSEQEAGYLAGALAGMVEQEGTLKGLNGAKVVSAIGGQKIPPVEKYLAGYQAGVKKYCSGCKVIIDYSQDFIDQGKCQDRANAQMSKGSDIVFQVAGGCGLGALSAVKAKGVWGIGVDADQAYLGAHILTSAVKNVDVAVFDTIKAVGDDSFQGGSDGVYGLEQDGVGLGEIAPAAKQYETQVATVIADVKAGKVTIPTSPK